MIRFPQRRRGAGEMVLGAATGAVRSFDVLDTVGSEESWRVG